MTENLSHLDQLAEALVDEHAKLLKHLINQRHAHNLTQTEVADRMGVSQPTVAAFEHYDANPTLATIRRYALAVGASVSHVVADACCDAEESFDAIVKSVTPSWSASKRNLTWAAPTTCTFNFVSLDSAESRISA